MVEVPAPSKPWYLSREHWLGIALIVLPIAQEAFEYLASQDITVLDDPNKLLMMAAGVIAIVLRYTSKGEKITLK